MLTTNILDRQIKINFILCRMIECGLLLKYHMKHILHYLQIVNYSAGKF